MRLIILGFLLFPTIIRANPIYLSDFYIEVEKYINGTSGNLPQGEQTHYLPTLGFNLSVLKYGYLNTEIQSETTRKQFRYVAMENEAGFKPHESIEIYYRHYSGHFLDAPNEPHYQYDNVVGFRFHIGGQK